MSKAPKKTPATASWRTLMRRADAATNLTAATNLREQAASLRRDERKAAKKPKRKTVPEPDQGAQIRQEWFDGINKFRDTHPVSEVAGDMVPRNSGIMIPSRDEAKSWGWNVPEEPGRGEIVGGEVAKLADTLAALARKKGGTDAVQAELARLIHIARYEGQKAADDRHTKTVKDIHDATTDKIVCSFIAVTEAEMKRCNGLPPAVTVSSYTLCRMLDALNRAGYSAEGRKEVGR